MKYMGSKNKIAKDILPYFLEILENKSGLYHKVDKYIEPFMGGCNMLDKIPHIDGIEKIASDKNPYLMALFKNRDKVRSMPDTITKEVYDDVRDFYNFLEKMNTGIKTTNVYPMDKYEHWYIGAVGFLASYNGRFFDGGYSGERITKDGKGNGLVRNYYREARDNFIEQSNKLNDVTFIYENWYGGDYRQFSNERNALIYCDIPYRGTKQYNTSKGFDYQQFWKWVNKMSGKGNIVLVSEQRMPTSDIVSFPLCKIWENKVTRTLRYDKTCIASEVLISTVPVKLTNTTPRANKRTCISNEDKDIFDLI